MPLGLFVPHVVMVVTVMHTVLQSATTFVNLVTLPRQLRQQLQVPALLVPREAISQAAGNVQFVLWVNTVLLQGRMLALPATPGSQLRSQARKVAHHVLPAAPASIHHQTRTMYVPAAHMARTAQPPEPGNVHCVLMVSRLLS